jgi:class 3 adenylate cyclase/tetratricopeptide (TPR) repeat protein
MINCPSCATESPVGVKFCPECGTKLGAAAAIPRDVRKLVTVMFVDASGSTQLGEQLDPEAIRVLMARYFAVMKRVIEAHGGTVEKFIGDAVMAVFGIPIVHEDDAIRAVRAAIDIRSELTHFDAELAASGSVTIQFRIGVDSGQVVAGDPGAAQAFVTGDTVNTAARLEQAARPGEILIGRSTLGLVRDAVVAIAIDPIAAKGKSEPVEAHRLVSVLARAPGRARRMDGPLVGRERELGRLEQALRQTIDDRTAHLFTLVGSAGVGKSRLAAEFINSAMSEATVLRGRCLPYGEGVTYWPIGEVVRGASGFQDADSAEHARNKLRASLEGDGDADLVASHIASAIGLSSEPAPQEEIFWAIRRFLEHLAIERPLVVLLEDIHWAEPTLLDLIEHIADWSRDAPILLLCLARQDLLETRTTWGYGKFNATTALLEPLGTDAIARLIATLPGGTALPEAVFGRVVAAAEGNPLYVEEFLSMLVDEGFLGQDGNANWTTAADLGRLETPTSVGALVSARLERLGPAERAVAERASIVGRVFGTAAVIELSADAARPDVPGSLLALVRKDFVRPERTQRSPSDSYEFRHILIRDMAYQALPKSERAELHERFADWLERETGERIAEIEEILGSHLEQAYRYRIELGESGELVRSLGHRAGIRLAAAGRRALDRGDMAGAVGLMSGAVDLFQRGSSERLELIPDQGFALFSTGRVREAQASLESAVEEAIVFGHKGLATRSRLEASLIQVLTAGEHRAARETASQAIEGLELAGDDSGLAKAWLVLATSAWMAGQTETALDARERATHYANRAGEGSRVQGRTTFSGAECYGPAPAVAAILSLEGQRDAARVDPLKRVEALFSLAGLYAMRDRLGEARDTYRELGQIYEELGMSVYAAAQNEVAGIAELIGGDPRLAADVLDQGIRGLENVGATSYLATLLALKSLSLARDGAGQDALEIAERAIRDGSPEDVMIQILANTARAEALVALDDADSAEDAAREAVRRADTTDFVTFRADGLLAMAAALESRGAFDEAVLRGREALGLFEAKQNLPGCRRARAFLGRVNHPQPGLEAP